MIASTVIVAGITRSGLSLTMQMLSAGGYPCKGEWPAFEPFQIGRIPWSECKGFAVKLIDPQRRFPPPGDYRIIRLSRDLREQAKSFNQFNAAFGFPPVPAGRLIKSFKRDYRVIDKWARRHRTMRLDFETIITDTTHAAEMISTFVRAELDIEKMVACVVVRNPECHPGLLELSLIQKGLA